jgi:hypothetical protein
MTEKEILADLLGYAESIAHSLKRIANCLDNSHENAKEGDAWTLKPLEAIAEQLGAPDGESVIECLRSISERVDYIAQGAK